jgi:IclR helix-turn-helix domain
MLKPSPAPGRAPAGGPVVIELSEAQVDRVVRAALGTGNMSVLLSGMSDVRDVVAAAMEQLEGARLSRSLLCGLLLLATFPADGSYVGIVHVARTLGMSVSTVHRYLTTLVAVGLLEQDSSTRKYRLMNAG